MRRLLMLWGVYSAYLVTGCSGSEDGKGDIQPDDGSAHEVRIEEVSCQVYIERQERLRAECNGWEWEEIGDISGLVEKCEVDKVQHEAHGCGKDYNAWIACVHETLSECEPQTMPCEEKRNLYILCMGVAMEEIIRETGCTRFIHFDDNCFEEAQYAFNCLYADEDTLPECIKIEDATGDGMPNINEYFCCPHGWRGNDVGLYDSGGIQASKADGGT